MCYLSSDCDLINGDDRSQVMAVNKWWSRSTVYLYILYSQLFGRCVGFRESPSSARNSSEAFWATRSTAFATAHTCLTSYHACQNTVGCFVRGCFCRHLSVKSAMQHPSCLSSRSHFDTVKILTVSNDSENIPQRITPKGVKLTP